MAVGVPKVLLAVSIAAVIALIVASGIQHRAFRSDGGGLVHRARSKKLDPLGAAGDTDQTLGESIRQVAHSVEDIHRRIQRLGKAIGDGPLPDAVEGKSTGKKEDSSPKGAAKVQDGAGGASNGRGDGSPAATKLPKRQRPPANALKLNVAGGPAATPLANLEDSIFVSVASYRDEQCAPTIYDMYQKAANPQALFLGVVEQHDNQDQYCMPKEFLDCQLSSFCPSDQIQIRRIAPKDARGPTYGRYLGMLMYRGEKYYMMIDSHNRFVTHWDAVAIRLYNKLPTKKGVLSHYPEAWNNPEDGGATNAPLDNRPTTTYLCTAKFVEMGYPRLDGFVVHKTTKSREQPWAAAGFLFADAKLVLEVPFDPHLHFVFDGEEILYSVRMWTHGWDIFSPAENILYHYYYRTKAKKFWSLLPHDWIQRRDGAHRRIQWYLGVLKQGTDERLVPIDTKEESVLVDRDKYGLGKERTLEAYWKYAGVDMKARTVENKFCPRA
jgi:hypothetical protein